MFLRNQRKRRVALLFVNVKRRIKKKEEEETGSLINTRAIPLRRAGNPRQRKDLSRAFEEVPITLRGSGHKAYL